jgi:hypothetical protein
MIETIFSRIYWPKTNYQGLLPLKTKRFKKNDGLMDGEKG